MELSEEYGGLQGLLQDLSSLSEPWMLQNIDRLCAELEGTIEDFKKLLDKKPKNNTSRQAIQSKKFSIDGVEYEVNDEFQEGTLQLADALDLDELDAARLFIEAQSECQQLDRPPRFVAILNFHQQRECLLQCLRIILRESFEPERELLQEHLRGVIRKILGVDEPGKTLRDGSLFARKVLGSLADIERWLQGLNDQVQRASVVGPMQDSDMELLELQSANLVQQHEHLSAILCYLFKGTYTDVNDLLLVIDASRQLTRFDVILVHYVPALIAGIFQHGSPEFSQWADMKSIHQKIVHSRDAEPWNIPLFHSALIAIWLTLYSAWFLERSTDPECSQIRHEKDVEQRTTLFLSTLDDGALEFLLAICASLTSNEWRDPTREELVKLLLRDKVQLIPDIELISEGIRPLVMEYLDVFTDCCVANMPDAVRQLKTEEDNQRLEQMDIPGEDLRSGLHRGLVEARTHLETFLVVMAFAFEHRIEAAQSFWVDTDGHLYGFIQWASKRQTVPRVSAFCELLCAVSEGEECAESAHVFLSDGDSKGPGARARRSTTMNWAQMFEELRTYANRLTERQPAVGMSSLPINRHDPAGMREPESPVMLASYLRLTAHLCRESPKIREWLWDNAELKVFETCFGLANGPIPTYLRSSIFSVLQAIIADKTTFMSEDMWMSLDSWVYKIPSTTTGLGKPNVSSHWSGRPYLDDIGMSLDQCTAFVALLQNLFQIPADSADISEALSFPPTLGSQYRMPGVEPYVDFVIGQAFTKKVTEFKEQNSRYLRWHCLNFIATCLESFNESLVFIANQITDSADQPSVWAYFTAHPFSRVMEWIFNGEVIKALYDAAHQDATEISKASPDSVSVCSLIRTLEIMSLVLDLQSSYFFIARSGAKDQSRGSGAVIPKTALSSFEDSVLGHLDLITDLCLYSGSSHDGLVLSSLSLLKKLTSSPKLTRTSKTTFGPSQAPNKVIEMLNNEVGPDRVALSLSKAMEVSGRELLNGPTASGYRIKLGVLDLLDYSLSAVTHRTCIGHVILGFSCVGNCLDVQSDSLFAQGQSLFHSVVTLAQIYPENLDNSMCSWMLKVKTAAFRVLKHLWSSKISAPFTLSELRESQILPVQFARTSVVRPDTLWDNAQMGTLDFWASDAPSALEDFLEYRSLLFQYAVVELRSAASTGSSTLLNSILGTLMGTSSDENGQTVSHSTIFDLFDLADLEIFDALPQPEVNFFAGVDFDICEKELADGLRNYDLDAVHELIEIHKHDLVDQGAVKTLDDDPLTIEANELLLLMRSHNYLRRIRRNFASALRSWTDLLIVIIDVCDIEQGQKTQLILHSMQLILPKLEAYLAHGMEETQQLLNLTETLIDHLGRESGKNAGRGGEVINDRLFQLSQLCIRGVVLGGSDSGLKEVCYNIISKYLNRILGSDIASMSLQRRSRQAIKTAGMSFVEIACDDAYSGTETCRISALILLNLLASLDGEDSSSFLLPMVIQSNYLNMFIDSVRSIRSETEITSEKDVPLLLTYYGALLSLLWQLCQTKVGANEVLNAGIFKAVRDSGLLTADPDIGIDMGQSNALRHYYELVLSVIRVLVTAVFMRGLHNKQMVEQARSFLAENRQSIVGIFKRYANIGSVESSNSSGQDLEGLVKSFTALIAATEFLEFEDDQQTQRPRGPRAGFS